MLNILKSKKIIYSFLGLILIVVTMPIFSAFEAHIVNVTAAIDNPVKLLTSNGEEVLPIGECYTITWEAENELPRLGDISSIDLYYSTDGGNSYPDENKITTIYPVNDIIADCYKWKVPNNPSDQGRIKVLVHYNGIDAPDQVDYSDENFDIAYIADGNTVALWHFNNNEEEEEGMAYDETANENDGTLNYGTGGSNTSYADMWTSGKYKNALSFDGTDDYVEVSDSNSLDITDEITIEAWIKPDSMDDYESFVHKDNAYVLQFAPGSDGYLRGALWLPGLTILDDTTTQLSAGEWYHVALTYNGSVMKLYVDEIEVASKNVSGNIAVNSNLLYIGYNPRDPSNPDHWWYDGIIDEVRISKIARDFNIVCENNGCNGEGNDSPPEPLTPPDPVSPKPGEVVINEIMWTGSSKSDNDQWIELKNISSDSLNLKGCKLKYKKASTGNENKIAYLPDDNDIILDSSDYYLISHYTEGSSNISIVPNFYGTSKVNNFDYSQFQIKLYCPDAESNMIEIDLVGDGVNPPLFGENGSPKKSMERCDDGTWQTATTRVNWDEGTNEKGTPGTTNLSCSD